MIASDVPLKNLRKLSERVRPPLYGELCKRMAVRYSDFKMNNQFHALRKPLLDDEKYAKVRYLDLENKVGPRKPYFNANILQVFDQHYTKKVG
ncbi:Uncharacterised protein [Burkholderia pseudomallei]|uniref:hypothetical protein n=1 Tax=Burkholderia pseudomallei TaxID=28450 RepID=UPI0005E40D4A|nr:hypothetical protein [Burkholderia pseudomallei]AYX06993.1 hypothetical protein EGY14_25300 [Burkholderia pseudomallei]CAJ3233176.1 Uncharacterised protein [Burkholderia pseudomallei]CAJ4341667.1 Uncharacterised protein [Burkholderia pseudomallei]CAJ4508892.1 Uncharacterised protein [Burkholderia pseudomallei]CAJ5887298.1 Uncharacterised protein [Burkholderia pseudomallei]